MLCFKTKTVNGVKKKKKLIKYLTSDFSTLGLVITGLVIQGFGLAAVLVSSFTDALRTGM